MRSGARSVLVLAGLLGASGIVFAALGAHLADAGGGEAAWQSASLLHLMHAAALLGVGLAADRKGGGLWLLAAGLMVAGTLLFCGSIYRAGLLGLDGAGPTAPLGGSSLILAWAVVAVAAWRSGS